MKSLKKVIGPAPSEDPEAFLIKLKDQRRRMGEQLSAFRARLVGGTVRKKPKTATKKSSSLKKKADEMRQLEKAVKEAGMTMEEFYEMSRKEKK